jgi:hypothetical protein
MKTAQAKQITQSEDWLDVEISQQVVEEWATEWIQDEDNLRWLFNQHHNLDYDDFVYGKEKINND